MYEGYPPRGFLPPALGAYVLSQHRTKVSSSLSSADDVSMQDEPHTLRINQSFLLTPSAIIEHQAEQIANARRRAAEGSLAPYTIPSLQIHRHGPVKIVSLGPSNSRCQRPQRGHCSPIFCSSWPDHVAQYGPVRAQTLGLYIPDSIKVSICCLQHSLTFPFSNHFTPCPLTSSSPRHRLPCIVLRLLSDCPCTGLLLPPPCAAPGMALQPLPGWASLWLLLELSTLSSLRQAKIN